jgi:hypothetical protein
LAERGRISVRCTAGGDECGGGGIGLRDGYVRDHPVFRNGVGAGLTSEGCPVETQQSVSLIGHVLDRPRGRRGVEALYNRDHLSETPKAKRPPAWQFTGGSLFSGIKRP